MKPIACGLALWIGIVSASVVAVANPGHHSPYAGEETREVKSLSPEDVRQLRGGAGWGLAKAAELNGYPGPIHLLELKAELGLSPQQIAAISAIYEAMRSDAIRLGEELIRREEGLESRFRRRTIDEAALREALDGIAAARRDLRFVHLSAHLKIMPHLTEQQVAAYWTLRGYGTPDLCAQPPAGHDPAMWRKHNCR